MQPEQVLQQECIASFRNRIQRYGKGAIIPVPNELARKRKDVEIHKGCSDLILIFRGKVVFCELKTRIGVQSDEQKAFERLVNSLGFEYFLIRSLFEFNLIIDTYET